MGNAIGRGNRHLFLTFLWLELGAILVSTIVAVVRIHDAVAATKGQVRAACATGAPHWPAYSGGPSAGEARRGLGPCVVSAARAISLRSCRGSQHCHAWPICPPSALPAGPGTPPPLRGSLPRSHGSTWC